MPKSNIISRDRLDRTICPRCNTRPMVPGKKGSLKATCPNCGDEWNFDIMRCPDCHVLLHREGRGLYRCFRCNNFTPMKEAELRVKLEKHYSNEGYDKLWGSKDNGPGADFIFYKKNISRILVVETKGENPSQIGGLADIQKALGQIVEHMDNPRGTNIGVLELYAKAGATLTYAIALPCTQRYLDWCSDRVSRPTRKKLDLHWIFVDYTGQVHSVDPEHSIVEIIPLKG